jgi:hypothetical protein
LIRRLKDNPAIAAGGQGGDHGDALARFDHGDLRIEVIENAAGMNGDPHSRQMLADDCWTSWPGASTMMGSPFRADQVLEVRRKVGSLSGRITMREKRNRGVRFGPENQALLFLDGVTHF